MGVRAPQDHGTGVKGSERAGAEGLGPGERRRGLQPPGPQPPPGGPWGAGRGGAGRPLGGRGLGAGWQGLPLRASSSPQEPRTDGQHHGVSGRPQRPRPAQDGQGEVASRREAPQDQLGLAQHQGLLPGEMSSPRELGTARCPPQGAVGPHQADHGAARLHGRQQLTGHERVCGGKGAGGPRVRPQAPTACRARGGTREHRGRGAREGRAPLSRGGPGPSLPSHCPPPTPTVPQCPSLALHCPTHRSSQRRGRPPRAGAQPATQPPPRTPCPGSEPRSARCPPPRPRRWPLPALRPGTGPPGSHPGPQERGPRRRGARWGLRWSRLPEEGRWGLQGEGGSWG